MAEFIPVGIVNCPKCNLSSLSWNIICARCDTDLFPDEHVPEISETKDDNGDRHKQENAA